MKKRKPKTLFELLTKRERMQIEAHRKFLTRTVLAPMIEKIIKNCTGKPYDQAQTKNP